MSEPRPVGRSATSDRTWVEIEERVFWRVDVTDFLDDPVDPALRERDLRQLARAVLDHKERQIGDGIECEGYGWAS